MGWGEHDEGGESEAPAQPDAEVDTEEAQLDIGDPEYLSRLLAQVQEEFPDKGYIIGSAAKAEGNRVTFATYQSSDNHVSINIF